MEILQEEFLVTKEPDSRDKKNKKDKKFIAHLGLGYWGKNILRNLYELGLLYAACDPDSQTVEERKKQFPDVQYAAGIEDILKDPAVRAVSIAAPAALHYRLAKDSLLSGKDVYVEKPLALTVAEGEELVEIARREGRVLMVGHILQYHPAVVKLKEFITEGVLGRIEYIYSNRLNIGKLRTEENILWSFAPHDISVILMLLGEEPVKVSAQGGAYLSEGVYDTTLTFLEFAGGVKGHIFVSWLHPFKEQKLVIVGSKAMAVFDDISKEKLFLYPHKIEWRDGKIPVAQKADYEVVPVGPGEPLKLELAHFAECVLERKTPLTDGCEGLRVLKVLEAAERSISSSKNKDFAAGKKSEKSICFSPGRTKNSESPDVFVHQSAFVDVGVKLGAGTRIWHFSHIMGGSEIGEGCVIGQNVVIGPDARIGNRCKIQNNVSVYKGVVLEDEVFCGPSCVFTNVYTPRAFVERKHEFLPTIVKRGATIGANATVVCGSAIGRYALVGAGAVVKSDVPDYAVIAGVPARQMGWACKCGVPLKVNGQNAVCANCGSEYRLENGKFTVIKENL